MCIYRHPSQNKQYFLDKLSEIIDCYASINNNYIILEDLWFLSKSIYMQSHNLFDLIRWNTCFKVSGSYIDPILENQKFCFKTSSAFETGLRNHRHLKQLLKKKTQNVSFIVIIKISTMNIFKMILKMDCWNALKTLNYLKMYL